MFGMMIDIMIYYPFHTQSKQRKQRTVKSHTQRHLGPVSSSFCATDRFSRAAELLKIAAFSPQEVVIVGLCVCACKYAGMCGCVCVAEVVWFENNPGTQYHKTTLLGRKNPLNFHYKHRKLKHTHTHTHTQSTCSSVKGLLERGIPQNWGSPVRCCAREHIVALSLWREVKSSVCSHICEFIFFHVWTFLLKLTHLQFDRICFSCFTWNLRRRVEEGRMGWWRGVLIGGRSVSIENKQWWEMRGCSTDTWFLQCVFSGKALCACQTK